MTSVNEQRLEKASGLSRRLLALLIGLLLTLAAIVSGATPAAAQNAVGPQPASLIFTVGAQTATAPEGVGLHALPLRQLMSATGVAEVCGPVAILTGAAGAIRHIARYARTGNSSELYGALADVLFVGSSPLLNMFKAAEGLGEQLGRVAMGWYHSGAFFMGSVGLAASIREDHAN